MAKKRSLHYFGQRIGSLVVVADAGRSDKFNRAYQWLCRCDCGHYVLKTTGEWNRGKGRKHFTCGFHRVEPSSVAYNILFRDYESRAKRRNLEWGLSKDETIALFKGDCAYCGIEPLQMYRAHRNFKTTHQAVYNGIDRIDNSKGYVPGNVCSCCKTCNYAKHEMTVAEFREWRIRIYRAVHDEEQVNHERPLTWREETDR